MDAKKLEINTLSVQIKVLTIDQKRFTKSVFNQLPNLAKRNAICFDEGIFRQNLIGYVSSDGCRTPLFEINGVLWRFLKPSITDELEDQVINKLWSTLTVDKQLFISI